MGSASDERTLDNGLPQGLRIEAVKEGEEPVSFGPSAVLAHYGRGWSLQTITEEGFFSLGLLGMMWHSHGQRRRHNKLLCSAESRLRGAPRKPSGGHITPGYIGRIALAFVFMFFLGGLLTLFLEYLPPCSHSSPHLPSRTPKDWACSGQPFQLFAPFNSNKCAEISPA
ncbi:unnamed protein product [Spirodela intermedia]|uniref:Uncharacterized protein n=1 Tax=Spirodela intermedia TaxID=51605 RepID=A0A7I8ILH4_SPIIN|nr:unnamed protein product [Spirodela intermedia]CAA6658596.1 unnamed protein product [Spirodela intermedia]